MKVTVIPIVTDAHGTITKRLLPGMADLEIRGRVETIQTTAVFEIGQNTILETKGNLQSFKLQ